MPGLAVQSQHHKVHRHVAFEVGFRKQVIHELIAIDLARLRFKHEAHIDGLARLVAHIVEQRKHCALGLLLLGRKRLFILLGTRIRNLLNAVQNRTRRSCRRQLINHELPLTARQIFKVPASTNTKLAASRTVDGAYFILRRNNLTAAREVRGRHQLQNLV